MVAKEEVTVASTVTAETIERTKLPPTIIIETTTKAQLQLYYLKTTIKQIYPATQVRLNSAFLLKYLGILYSQ